MSAVRRGLRRIGQRLALVLLPTLVLLGTAEVLIRLSGMEQIVARQVSKETHGSSAGGC